MKKPRFFDEEWMKHSSQKRRELLQKKVQGLKLEVLYLDDQEEQGLLVKELFQDFGLDCFFTSDPQVALDYVHLHKKRLILIISDLKMPNLDGFAFRQRALAIDTQIPFVIMTGFMDQTTALKGIDGKIAAFIQKPFEKDHLIQILQEHSENQIQTILEEHELLTGFIDDAQNILEDVEALCLELENGHQDSAVDLIFGKIHTIKGSSGFFDPRTLHDFAHHFEDSLKNVQNKSRALVPDLVNGWLKATDQLKMLVQELSNGIHQDHDLEKFKCLFDVENKTLTPGPTTTGAPTDGGHTGEGVKSQKNNEIKVSMTLLDEFMQTSGELTVIRNIINKTVQSLEKKYAGDKEVGAMSELLSEMHRINSDVQNKITDLRKVSVKLITKPLTRIVKETAKALGKEVKWEIQGEDLRLDQSILEIINQCLVHMLRNSIDHGIEKSVDRTGKGKSPQGTVILSFEQRDENIFVGIQDDGKGIDTEKIKEIAFNKGLITKEKMQSMPKTEVYQLLFAAGFSTAQTVTDFSGRGVGMSMVKELILAQEGEIKIESEVGKGSLFEIKIPLPKSVLITQSLFLKSGERVCALAQANIAKVYDQTQGLALEKVPGGEVMKEGRRHIPVFSLNALFGDAPCEEPFVLVLESKGRKMGLKVSQLMDSEDAVIKEMSIAQIDPYHLFQGATFLADGKVGLALSCEGLLNHFAIGEISEEKEVQVTEVKGEMHPLMLFKLGDESIFGIDQKWVGRIEKFSSQLLKSSQAHQMLPYRGGLLPFVDGRPLFGAEKNENLEEYPLLVLHMEGREIGLLVSEIIDLVEIEGEIGQNLNKKMGILGHLEWAGKAVSLIAPDQWLSQNQQNETPKQELQHAA